MKILVYIVYMLVVAASGLLAQPVPDVSSGIRIIPRTLKVWDDSVRISLDIRAVGIRIPSDESLSLIPELQKGKKRVVLPSVVLSGAERARFDRREATVSPDVNRPVPYHVWSGVRRGNNYVLTYQVSIPYASWMEHASLRLRQVGKDCCTEQLLAYDVLTEDINLESPYILSSDAPVIPSLRKQVPLSRQEQVLPVQPDETPVLQAHPGILNVSVSAFIDYAYRSSSVVNPSLGGNREELEKVDKILSPLLENPAIRFREIRISCFLPSGGSGSDRKALSASRAEGFRVWLARAYGLQDYPFTTLPISGDRTGSGCIEVNIFYTED